MAGSRRQATASKPVVAEMPERPKRRIIVAREKHYTRYLEASTDETWAKSALALLTERFRAGYWYYDPDDESNEYTIKAKGEREALLAVSQETLADLPHTVMVELEKKIEEAKREEAALRDDRSRYLEIKRVVETQDLSWEGAGRRWAKPHAWSLLEQRSEGEYEDVELEDVEMPGEAEVDL
jgi:hypothetical protein